MTNVELGIFFKDLNNQGLSIKGGLILTSNCQSISNITTLPENSSPISRKIVTIILKDYDSIDVNDILRLINLDWKYNDKKLELKYIV
jgi:hypothetical protein